MKIDPVNSILSAPRGAFRLALLTCAIGAAVHASDPQLLDDFSRENATSVATPRIVVNDASLGGQSTAEFNTTDGILRVEGTLAPARGQPAFVSLVLLLSPSGEPVDVSPYAGIRLRVRVLEGGLQVLAASADIQNFDYHTAPVKRSGDFQEIEIPFADLKRIWSEQTPLNLERITSINLVASGMQSGSFSYEIDEIGFY
jgi:hypothetical protein